MVDPKANIGVMSSILVYLIAGIVLLVRRHHIELPRNDAAPDPS